jgi:hypothetical protein
MNQYVIDNSQYDDSPDFYLIRADTPNDALQIFLYHAMSKEIAVNRLTVRLIDSSVELVSLNNE